MDSEGVGAPRARGTARGRPPSVASQLNRMSVDVSSVSGDDGSQSSTDGRRQRDHSQSSTGSGTGRVVELVANFVELKTSSELKVHQYHVEFEPNIEAIRIRRGLLCDATRAMFNNAQIFDGMYNLKTLVKLPDEITELVTTRRSDNSSVSISLNYAGEIALDSMEMLRLYNTQIRRNLQHLSYVRMGRHTFDPNKTQTLPQYKLDIWSGVATSVNVHESGQTLMAVDTVHKFVRAETALEILRDLHTQDRNNFKDNARRQLAGAIVLTNYNNRTYKVDDIDFERNPSFEFDHKGTMKSLKQYYQQQHQIDIRDERQPLLIILPSARDHRAADGPPKPILLVPELCRMTGLTDQHRADFTFKRLAAQITHLEPKERFKGIEKLVQSMGTNEKVQEEMGCWGMSIGAKPLAIDGRELVDEKILMKGVRQSEGVSYPRKSADFSKQIRGMEMRESPTPVDNWALIVSKRDEGLLEDFKETMKRVCGCLGMTLHSPVIQILQTDRVQDFAGACKVADQKCKIVVVIVPNDNKERYDTIKKIFCIDNPVPSQVVIGRTLAKKGIMMSVCTKIAIQMAAKLGGVPWSLKIPLRKTMVAGYDTYHDSVQKNKSVGAFVCSLNPEITKYYSRASFHANGEEMSAHFAENLTHGLKEYFKLNNSLPERLVVYRDGVGEGQISHVEQFEIEQIRKCLDQMTQEIDTDAAIKLTFVIVTKRVNARFAKGTPGDLEHLENPLPGTAVDTVVTQQHRQDFYLVSHRTRAGTANPTHYQIIRDDSNWPVDRHEMLVFKLCHSYFNWMGTIRVPAPCQYAHKLAYLVGTSLHREPSPRLANTLFYL